MLDHKTNLNELKKIEKIQSIFSDHDGMKLKTKSRENFRKLTNK